MIAYLFDVNGDIIERLADIPVTLLADEAMRSSRNFAVPSPDPRPGHGLVGAINVRIETVVSGQGIKIRAFAFTDKADHKAIMDYMRKGI